MIALTGIDKVKLLKVNRTEEYSPIIYPLGIYSPEEAKTDLSNLHKKWLGLDERNCNKIVNIKKIFYNIKL